MAAREKEEEEEGKGTRDCGQTRDGRARHASTCGGRRPSRKVRVPHFRCPSSRCLHMSTILRRSTLRTTSHLHPLRAASVALRLTGTRTCRRSYSEASASLLKLPPPEEWYTIFDRFDQDRAMLKRLDTARLVAQSFLGDQSSVGGDGKVVIEAFPGMCNQAHYHMFTSDLTRRTGCSVPCSAGTAPL